MSARVLLSGVLDKAPVRMTSKAGKTYLRASVKAGNGPDAKWWSIFVFAEAAIETLEALTVGEAFAASGTFDATIWAPEGREPRVNLSMTADAIFRRASQRRRRRERAASHGRPPVAIAPRRHGPRPQGLKSERLSLKKGLSMTKFPSDSDDAPDNVADFNSRALAKKARERPAVSGDALVTEDSAARRFADLYNDQLRYCHSTGAWFEWNGQRWSQNQLGKAFHFARELARKMVESEPDKVRFIASKASFAGSVERYARQDPIFAVTANYWDRNPMLVGTPVGTVDLKTGVLRPGDPADGITKSTAVAPAETSDCPLWRRFIFEVCGADEGMVRFLQQWFGYSLTGDTREQMLVFIHGGGGNGKGVVVNTIKGIVGDYAATPTMESLTASKNDRHSTDFAMLRGARVACASETEKGRAWAESKIKQLTGGDDVTARFLYKNNFTFRPTFKLLIIGNDKPRLNNVGAAERRRYIIVPFNFKPEVPDKQLEEKLKAEWPAILRWMIEGCLDWQNNGLIRPQSVKDETEKYFSDQDLWAQWLEDDCDLEPENRYKMAGTGELFNSWSNYAKASGVDAGNNVDFASRLEREGCVRTREGKDRKRIWRGIEVRRDQSDNRYRD